MKTPNAGITDRKLPTQNRSRARVEKILKAAEELLLHNEIADITTSSIAKKANIPVGSVYQYFKERDSVLIALGQQVIQDINEQLTAVFSDVSQHAHWRHVVRETLSAYMKIHQQDELYHRLNGALFNNKEWINLNHSMEQQMIDFFSGYGLLDNRGFSDEQRQNIVRVIVVMCSSVVLRIKEPGLKDKADSILTELQDAVIAYLSCKLGD
ncbi:MAG: TetR/AcrR family transcriptional regulator [Sneathiella sp.]|nr:TetR/AcrR family transcriptional regulator [Sneathiella sp.]